MCVRYHAVDERAIRLFERLGFWPDDPVPEVAAADLFPGGEGQIIRREEGGLELSTATWGLQPSWADKATFGRTYAYNARSETLLERRSFRTAFASRRCVVPAASFFEQEAGRWVEILPTLEPAFLFAGLWEPANQWTQGRDTYTIVTTVPNVPVAAVQDRMPVVLDAADVAGWLDSSTSATDLRALMVPCADELVRLADAGPTGRGKTISETPSLF